jgi:hypothetical protein
MTLKPKAPTRDTSMARAAPIPVLLKLLTYRIGERSCAAHKDVYDRWSVGHHPRVVARTRPNGGPSHLYVAGLSQLPVASWVTLTPTRTTAITR